MWLNYGKKRCVIDDVSGFPLNHFEIHIPTTVLWKRNFAQDCAFVWKTKYTPCLSSFLLLAATTQRNHFLYNFIRLTLLCMNFGPFFLTMWLQFIEVCEKSLMSSSVEVLPQHFVQAELLTLTGLLQHLILFFFVDLLAVIVLLHDTISFWL